MVGATGLSNVDGLLDGVRNVNGALHKAVPKIEGSIPTPMGWNQNAGQIDALTEQLYVVSELPLVNASSRYLKDQTQKGKDGGRQGSLEPSYGYEVKVSAVVCHTTTIRSHSRLPVLIMLSSQARMRLQSGWA